MAPPTLIRPSIRSIVDPPLCAKLRPAPEKKKKGNSIKQKLRGMKRREREKATPRRRSRHHLDTRKEKRDSEKAKATFFFFPPPSSPLVLPSIAIERLKALTRGKSLLKMK